MKRAAPATARQRRHRPPETGNRPLGATALIALNAAGAVAAAAFAALGAAHPGYVDHKRNPGPPARFWAASSAVRTFAITIPLLAALARKGRTSPELLTAAGLVQLGDSALGIRRNDPSMAIAPALMGLIHLATARHLAHAE